MRINATTNHPIIIHSPLICIFNAFPLYIVAHDCYIKNPTNLSFQSSQPPKTLALKSLPLSLCSTFSHSSSAMTFPLFFMSLFSSFWNLKNQSPAKAHHGHPAVAKPGRKKAESPNSNPAYLLVLIMVSPWFDVKGNKLLPGVLYHHRLRPLVKFFFSWIYYLGRLTETPSGRRSNF